MRRRFRRENKRIALERISVLFNQAKEIFSKEPELAQYYVNLAKKIVNIMMVLREVTSQRLNCQ